MDFTPCQRFQIPPNLRVTIVAHSVCQECLPQPLSLTHILAVRPRAWMDLERELTRGGYPQIGWVWEAFFLEGRCGPMQATV